MALWLMCLYIVLLLTLPVDIGLAVGGLVVTPSRVVLLIAVLLAIVQWRSVLEAVRRVPAFVWVGWAAFLGASLVTALIFPSAASWGRYASLVGEGLVVFILVCQAATNRDGLRTLVVVFAVTLIVVAAAVAVLAAFGLHYDVVLSSLAGTVPATANEPRYGIERQFGPFRGATFFGIWLTAASALVLPVFNDARRRVRWLALLGWLALLVAILLTGSRQAMTAVFLAPAVYFLVRGPRSLGVASLLAAGAVVILVSVFPGNEFAQISTTARVSAVGGAIDALRAKPLFGWGLLSDQTVLSNMVGQRNFVDDTYLSITIETGVIGLSAFLLLMAGVLVTTWRSRASPLGLALTIVLVGVLGMGILVSFLQTSQGYAAFFVLAALGVAAGLTGVGRAQPAGAT